MGTTLDGDLDESYDFNGETERGQHLGLDVIRLNVQRSSLRSADHARTGGASSFVPTHETRIFTRSPASPTVACCWRNWTVSA